MTFTYTLTTDIGKTRLEIGDTDSTTGMGVRPDGTNLTDEEIQVWLTREGTVGGAAAAACEALARMWARMANVSAGPRSESLSDVAKAWAEQARVLRQQYGGAAVVVSAGVTREDGYSEHATGDDYS
jgi:hypothetical protein